MPDETPEQSVLTTEQQQRTHATLTAAQVLRPQPVRAGVVNTAPAESLAPYINDLIVMADYIVTGRSMVLAPPLLSFVDLGAGSYTLGKERDEAFVRDILGEFAGVAPKVLRDLLLLVDAEFEAEVPTIKEIEGWDKETVAEVARWASAVHLRASDNDVTVPPVPEILDGLSFD